MQLFSGECDSYICNVVDCSASLGSRCWKKFVWCHRGLPRNSADRNRAVFVFVYFCICACVLVYYQDSADLNWGLYLRICVFVPFYLCTWQSLCHSLSGFEKRCICHSVWLSFLSLCLWKISLSLCLAFSFLTLCLAFLHRQHRLDSGTFPHADSSPPWYF